MGRILALREFTRVGSDPRILLLDARERFSSPALDNAYVNARRLPRGADPLKLAQAVSGRHVVVIADDDERALDLCHVLDELEVTAWALEGGSAGWSEAVLVERCESHADGQLVIVLCRPSVEWRFYLVANGRTGLLISPSGSVPAVLEVARHYGCTVRGVVDVLEADDGGVAPPTSGPAFAQAIGAAYLSPSISAFVPQFAGMRIVPGGPSSLRIEGAGYTIGAAPFDPYRVGVSDRRPSRA